MKANNWLKMHGLRMRRKSSRSKTAKKKVMDIRIVSCDELY